MSLCQIESSHACGIKVYPYMSMDCYVEGHQTLPVWGSCLGATCTCKLSTCSCYRLHATYIHMYMYMYVYCTCVLGKHVIEVATMLCCCITLASFKVTPHTTAERLPWYELTMATVYSECRGTSASVYPLCAAARLLLSSHSCQSKVWVSCSIEIHGDCYSSYLSI